MNNATQYVVLIIYASLLLVVLIFSIAIYLLLGKQKAKNLQMQLEDAHRRLETESMKIRLELREEGYNALSKEIHDNFCQVLSSVSLALQSLEQNNLTDSQQRLIDQSFQRINQVTGGLRDFSHALNGDRVERDGLIISIAKEINFLQSNNIHRASFHCKAKSELPTLSDLQTLLIFRITQEAIHNIIKHAQATELLVTIDYDPIRQIFLMSIEDNGIGILTEEAAGLGLISMKDRAILLGADLVLSPGLTKGTVITLTLNLRNEQNKNHNSR